MPLQQADNQLDSSPYLWATFDIWNMVCLCPLRLAIMLRFDISKEPIDRGCCVAGCELVAKAQGYQLVCFRGSLVEF